MAPRRIKRRSARVDFEAPVVVRTRLGSVRGTCRNLSVGGLFFTGPMLPVGERVFLAVTIAGRTLQVEGQIRYQHAYADGTGMGVVFTMLSPEDLHALERLVTALLDTGSQPRAGA